MVFIEAGGCIAFIFFFFLKAAAGVTTNDHATDLNAYHFESP